MRNPKLVTDLKLDTEIKNDDVRPMSNQQTIQLYYENLFCQYIDTN